MWEPHEDYRLFLYFYSRPCGRGDRSSPTSTSGKTIFLLTPLREGRLGRYPEQLAGDIHFYSRPCGRGDRDGAPTCAWRASFLLTPLREGRPVELWPIPPHWIFLLTPLREGRLPSGSQIIPADQFLLTPLREGRHHPDPTGDRPDTISTHAPAGGATVDKIGLFKVQQHFYSRPCGRGDGQRGQQRTHQHDFYSRPCGRGDGNFPQVRHEVLRQIAER